MLKIRYSLLLSLLIVTAFGCGDASRSEPSSALNFQITGGSGQAGLAGEELPDPIMVSVTGDNQEPVSGIIINFVVTAGGGHVFAGSALTNDHGEARERWTLGEVGDNVLEARSVDQTTGEPIVHAQVHATAFTTPIGEPAAHYIPPEYRSQDRRVGQVIDVRDFVFVYDGAGTPIPDPQFTLSADPGFVIEGTTVRADPESGEIKGIVRLSLGGIPDSFDLGFLPDFTGLNWRATYSCPSRSTAVGHRQHHQRSGGE